MVTARAGKKGRAAGTRRRKGLRLGLYGGTFDPVHHGHLVQAHDALEQLGLDAVVFIPCRRSPHKAAGTHAADRQRLAMLRLALKGEPRFWLSRCELDRPAPSYAVETAEEIGAAFPKAELFWLIGADQLPRLNEWHRIGDLRRLLAFVVLARPGFSPKKGSGPVLGLPRPRQIDISATEVRHRVKSCLPIDHLVPAPVAAYLRRHRLYA